MNIYKKQHYSLKSKTSQRGICFVKSFRLSESCSDGEDITNPHRQGTASLICLPGRMNMYSQALPHYMLCERSHNNIAVITIILITR